MTPDQHAKTKAIFLEACAQPSEHRASFVSRACAGDKVLLQEVQRLLANHLPGGAAVPHDRSAKRVEVNDRTLDISEFPSFQTGDLILGRYRIVALLGEGAMGRVYRAEDTQLNQAVALKFLPKLHILDPTWRRRVELEVKLSREVGHPNICRVYDLGDVEGSPFISMEYIDGENLASLLRRVGRLTGTRAIDIARQLCAGLAAAHVRGVLHRDLKPANVMIDHKGRVRITDFGLAVISGQVDRREIRAGTPRYMAPEQLAGVQVTEASDIYSLGLVLYEMFTGRPAFDAKDVLEYLRLHQTAMPPTPSEIVPEIDPKVEAVIMACLRKDPADRPESALNVAAALPGGDILAAALDAGQIPTREMLANAAAQGNINRRGMYQIAAAALVLFVLAIVLGNNTHPVARNGGVKSPEILLERAREVSRIAGHAVTSKYVDCRYFPSADLKVSSVASRTSGDELQLAFPPDGPLLFRFQERVSSPAATGSDVLSFIMPGKNPFAADSDSDASSTVILDGAGRLLFLELKSPARPDLSSAENSADWKSLVRATGHDPRDLVPAQPMTLPEVYAEEQLAFLSSSGSAEAPVRIEIATNRHDVRFLAVLHDASAASKSAHSSNLDRWNLVRNVRNSVLLVLLAVALPAAWKNWKNRGDLAGAMRLGLVVSGLRLLGSLLAIRNLGGFSDCIEDLTGSAISALCEGMIIALFYMAMESQVRLEWPRTLGCWSRVLAGRLRDPFVGRDVLIGCLVGSFWAILVFIDRRLPVSMGWETRTHLRLYQGMEDLLGSRFAVSGVLETLRSGVYQGLVMLFLIVIAMWLASPRRWLAILVAWFIGSAMFAPTASHPITGWTLFPFGLVAVALFVLIHCGLVSVLAAVLVVGWLAIFPITTNLNAWYAGYGLFACAATAGLAGWSFYQAIQLPTPKDLQSPGY